MGLALVQDEFEVGMHVIGLDIEQTYPGMSDFGTTVMVKEDNFYAKEVWEVAAVDLPFIVIQSVIKFKVNPHSDVSGKPVHAPRPIDVRVDSFKKVSKEFVEAILAGR